MHSNEDPMQPKIKIIFKNNKKIKRRESLTHATTWMNLEDIMLSEISQSQKKTNTV